MEQMVKRKRGLHFAIIGVGIILIIAVIIGVIALGGSDSRKLQEQLNLGAKYLEEMDYEQALVAYQAALEIDPKNADAYLGMAEAYVGMGDFAMALQTLEQGYEKTGDGRLLEEIEHLKELNRMPVEGEVILPYSMNESVYFKTLQTYRYNPAMLISAGEGTQVRAAAGGIVVNIYEDVQIGQVLFMSLNKEPEILVAYGQLQNIQVAVGDSVAVGDIIAEVAAPTKYYSEEGSHLYIEVTESGVPINPKEYFGW